MFLYFKASFNPLSNDQVLLDMNSVEIMIMMQSLMHQPVCLNSRLSNPWGIPQKKNILPSSSPFLSLCSFFIFFLPPSPLPSNIQRNLPTNTTHWDNKGHSLQTTKTTPLPSLLLLDLWPYLWSGWDEWREWNSRCPFDISSIKGGIVRASKCTTMALCISHTNLLHWRINSGQS